MKTLSAILLAALIPLDCGADELPGDSIYNVGSDWLNQNNERSNIASWQGTVQVLGFVYTYCEHSCPIIISKLRKIERDIPEQLAQQVQFALVSLDPARDTPDRLHRYMQDHDLENGRWIMFNGDPDDVLELSALVGVRYKPMDKEGKDIAHSNMITVLDRQGRIHYQMKGLNESQQRVIAEIGKAARATP